MKIDSTVLDTVGSFFEGQIPRTVCFVPSSLISGGKLDEGQYVLQGWASLNIKAQPRDLRVGSHLFPDLKKPCNNQADCERIGELITMQRPQVETAV